MWLKAFAKELQGDGPTFDLVQLQVHLSLIVSTVCFSFFRSGVCPPCVDVSDTGIKQN
ncbi:hypothetical protein E1A91_A07G026300v1 [Gossypium mustelinum]|uniref:Uncharacterized protein n=3 Tax=Gossypium TaxID=3633 RepID=A0A5D2YGE7_GOSMU|nr:hypothetical protein ES288_A07G026800v1 [Gossypium darwinii]TYI17472.1 hypothetical protein ES332_A07G026500v1 [Gossypium tomentosum]TYJ25105.1 hypothetical protein E1A91_A07G026300v1 [Gossypium mustelinum]TYH08575.1 hypothetical protein ES288_A07G026800v1 [Gossypium darwinii]TYJ25106.1 hypothetical protein E1A91_A07G026300v1 [Gossypium mustelinum]